MSLLPEMYGEIAKHLPKEFQSKFRTVNKTFSALPISSNICCSPPNNYEVATWLINQVKIRDNPNTNQQSFLQKLYTYLASTIMGSRIVFRFNTAHSTKEISLHNSPNLYAGRGINSITLKSRDDILEYLGNNTLELSSKNIEIFAPNWLILREILASRQNCFGHRRDSDLCYIRLLNENLSYTNPYRTNPYNDMWIIILFYNKILLLNLEARQRLARDFQQQLNFPHPLNFDDLSYQTVPIYDPQLIPHQAVQWLRNWFNYLTPDDLITL